MTTNVVYRLRHRRNKVFLGFERSPNGPGADFCNATTVSLRLYGPLWEADTPTRAEYVRQHSTPWYNSSIDTPMNPFHAEDLEVVECTITETFQEVAIKIPTLREFYEEKMRLHPKEARHYEYALSQMQPNDTYSYYDLLQLLHERSKCQGADVGRV